MFFQLRKLDYGFVSKNILHDLTFWSMLFFSIIFVIYMGLKPKEIVQNISLVDSLLKNRGYIPGDFLKTAVLVS